MQYFGYFSYRYNMWNGYWQSSIGNIHPETVRDNIGLFSWGKGDSKEFESDPCLNPEDLFPLYNGERLTFVFIVDKDEFPDKFLSIDDLKNTN